MTMQTLQEVQKSLDNIGFNPNSKPFNRRILRILAITASAIVLQWIFLINAADNAKEYIESIYVVTTCTGVYLSFASTIFITEKLFSLIKSVDESVNKRLENSEAKAILEKTNQLVEKCSKIGIFLMKYVFVPCYVLLEVFVCFYLYFNTDLGNDAFVLPTPMWFPFDWKNPMGYSVAVFAQVFLAMYPSQHIGSFASLAFGVFMFSTAFGRIEKHELYTINKMAKDKKSQMDMYKQFSKFIQMNSSAKQLNIPFSDLYEITLTIVFVGCLITLCAAMLLVEIEISHNKIDSMVLLEVIVFGACALILLLFVCELGQRFSNDIDKKYERIIQLNWYLFPSKIQRVLPTVMQCTQKPIVIKCFGNVLCSREQFRKVVKSAYSYFMVLRKFYK